MEQMVRKQIYIERRQEALLKRAAKQRGMSEAEIIRQALERELAAGSIRKRMEGDAFARAHKFIVARRARGLVNVQPYRWRREDAYEERLDRQDPRTRSRG